MRLALSVARTLRLLGVAALLAGPAVASATPITTITFQGVDPDRFHILLGAVPDRAQVFVTIGLHEHRFETGVVETRTGYLIGNRQGIAVALNETDSSAGLFYRGRRILRTHYSGSILANPEPSAALLFGVGIAVVAHTGRRKAQTGSTG